MGAFSRLAFPRPRSGWMAQLAALVAVAEHVPEWHRLDAGGTAVDKTHAALVGVAGREVHQGHSLESFSWA